MRELPIRNRICRTENSGWRIQFASEFRSEKNFLHFIYRQIQIVEHRLKKESEILLGIDQVHFTIGGFHRATSDFERYRLSKRLRSDGLSAGLPSNFFGRRHLAREGEIRIIGAIALYNVIIQIRHLKFFRQELQICSAKGRLGRKNPVLHQDGEPVENAKAFRRQIEHLQFSQIQFIGVGKTVCIFLTGPFHCQLPLLCNRNPIQSRCAGFQISKRDVRFTFLNRDKQACPKAKLFENLCQILTPPKTPFTTPHATSCVTPPATPSRASLPATSRFKAGKIFHAAHSESVVFHERSAAEFKRKFIFVTLQIGDEHICFGIAGDMESFGANAALRSCQIRVGFLVRFVDAHHGSPAVKATILGAFRLVVLVTPTFVLDAARGIVEIPGHPGLRSKGGDLVNFPVAGIAYSSVFKRFGALCQKGFRARRFIGTSVVACRGGIIAGGKNQGECRSAYGRRHFKVLHGFLNKFVCNKRKKGRRIVDSSKGKETFYPTKIQQLLKISRHQTGRFAKSGNENFTNFI